MYLPTTWGALARLPGCHKMASDGPPVQWRQPLSSFPAPPASQEYVNAAKETAPRSSSAARNPTDA